VGEEMRCQVISCSKGWHGGSGLVLFLSGVLLGTASSWAWTASKRPGSETILENDKVQVNRVLYEKDSVRLAHTRPRDQVIVFLDDARYSVAPAGGKKELRERKSGDVIWHSRGEEAPTLTNLGTSYRTVVVNLK
jgi:hypothetical protein